MVGAIFYLNGEINVGCSPFHTSGPRSGIGRRARFRFIFHRISHLFSDGTKMLVEDIDGQPDNMTRIENLKNLG